MEICHPVKASLSHSSFPVCFFRALKTQQEVRPSTTSVHSSQPARALGRPSWSYGPIKKTPQSNCYPAASVSGQLPVLLAYIMALTCSIGIHTRPVCLYGFLMALCCYTSLLFTLVHWGLYALTACFLLFLPSYACCKAITLVLGACAYEYHSKMLPSPRQGQEELQLCICSVTRPLLIHNLPLLWNLC